MKTTSTADKKIDNTAAELKALIHEAEEILAASGEESSDKLSDVRDRLDTLIHDGKEKVETLLEDGKEKVEQVKVVAKEKLETTDAYVRSHPYQAAGVAAGIGAVVGILAAKSTD
ncbi:MAG: hypothetical protein SynsKO_00700 [Synoicihabitans sp.]